ncbi:methyl-accepting chemotaxis protein [Spirochaeta cellobiosiphila]|uniref:methyl-accepting chemotaxis protein n=1 Tax=Spirochaeta cellobiosiphila TaxID=504483 RepID=UPI00042678D6|nr:methyl-accepting chemotaxis protein [Spirochaeta cellobiosiphila]
MKIKTQAFVMLLFSFIMMIAIGLVMFNQTKKTDALTEQLQKAEEGLILLNEFQVAAMEQVLYGVDVLRTGDISGDRIITYRMAETQMPRQIERLSELLSVDKSLHEDVDRLTKRGEGLARMCKEELLDPLYAHQVPDESLLGRLIYEELAGLKTDINTAREKLSTIIKEQSLLQSEQQENLLTIWLPAGFGVLFLLLFVNFLIIQFILSNINKTKDLLGVLAEGQGRLDVALPVKGKNEISSLRANFNHFMSNLNERHQSLLVIADQQVQSGERLNDVTVEHKGAVTNITENLNSIYEHSYTMEQRVSDSFGEVQKIAKTLVELNALASRQQNQVVTMDNHGKDVQESLARQIEAVSEQVRLTEQVRKEGLENRRIMELLKNQIKEILDNSSLIAKSIMSIQDLADQTDILAINASIEAAQAGNSGKGFSVVAGAMRQLSNEVRSNSSIITELLDELEGSLAKMAEEEKASQKTIDRLILQNRNAEEAVQSLKQSHGEIHHLTSSFFSSLKDILTESTKIHHISEDVRKSGHQISHHMEGIKDKQKELLLESEEMRHGLTQLANGTKALGELSEQNRMSTFELSQEIHKFGSRE